MSPKSNSKSDLKFGQINFNHGLTDEPKEGGKNNGIFDSIVVFFKL